MTGAPAWHAAVPGEAWVVTVEGLRRLACVVTRSGGRPYFMHSHGTVLTVAPAIIEATRLWPPKKGADQ